MRKAKDREAEIARLIEKHSQTAETKELRRLLENVSDTYSDFVLGALCDAERKEMACEITSFIKNNPEADTSNIIKYIYDIA